MSFHVTIATVVTGALCEQKGWFLWSQMGRKQVHGTISLLETL